MTDIKIIRYDEANLNVEALKGQYGQRGEKYGAFTVIKNLLFVNLYNGAIFNDYQLPSVYNGFVQLSNGNIIDVKDSKLTCKLPNDVNGFGVLVLKAWN